MKKESIFEKENVSILKSLFYKSGKAQNMPVVAARLGELLIKI